MAIRTVLKTITPQYAKAVLAKCAPNRNLRRRRVEQYKRDMLNSQWLVNHQGIAFDEDNNFIDGQHRLTAIAESGVTVDMLVTTGLPSTSKNGVLLHVMDTVDRNAVRSVADQLQLRHGVQNSTVTTSAAKVIGEICLGTTIPSLSTPATLLVLKQFGDAIADVIGRTRSKLERRGAVIGVTAFLLHANPDMGAEFCERFFSMEGLGKKSPVIALRKWLENNIGLAGSGGGRSVTIRAIATAMQAYFEKRDIHSIRPGYEGLDWLRKQYKKAEDLASRISSPGVQSVVVQDS